MPEAITPPGLVGAGVEADADEAARDFVPFDEAYEKTDWSKYRSMPAFNESNRVNAYNQYLRLEQEGVQ